MNKYGQTAIEAVRLIKSNKVTNPKEAWKLAVKDIFESRSSQDKSCPMNAFVGLCEAGLVHDVAADHVKNDREKERKNQGYAIKAVELLKENPALADDKVALWKVVLDGEVKRHNSQMDVVVSFWEKG